MGEDGRPLVDKPRSSVDEIEDVEWVSRGNYLVYIEDSPLPVMDWWRMARGATPTLDGQRENRLSFRPAELPGKLCRARGFEMDLVYSPTPNLRLAWNRGREERRVHDILLRFSRYLDTHLQLWQANTSVPLNSAFDETVGDLVEHILEDVNFERAPIGSRLLNNREWQTRFNLRWQRPFRPHPTRHPATSHPSAHQRPALLKRSRRLKAKPLDG